MTRYNIFILYMKGGTSATQTPDIKPHYPYIKPHYTDLFSKGPRSEQLKNYIEYVRLLRNGKGARNNTGLDKTFVILVFSSKEMSELFSPMSSLGYFAPKLKEYPPCYPVQIQIKKKPYETLDAYVDESQLPLNEKTFRFLDVLTNSEMKLDHELINSMTKGLLSGTGYDFEKKGGKKLRLPTADEIRFSTIGINKTKGKDLDELSKIRNGTPREIALDLNTRYLQSSEYLVDTDTPCEHSSQYECTFLFVSGDCIQQFPRGPLDSYQRDFTKGRIEDARWENYQELIKKIFAYKNSQECPIKNSTRFMVHYTQGHDTFAEEISEILLSDRWCEHINIAGVPYIDSKIKGKIKREVCPNLNELYPGDKRFVREHDQWVEEVEKKYGQSNKQVNEITKALAKMYPHADMKFLIDIKDKIEEQEAAAIQVAKEARLLPQAAAAEAAADAAAATAEAAEEARLAPAAAPATGGRKKSKRFKSKQSKKRSKKRTRKRTRSKK